MKERLSAIRYPVAVDTGLGRFATEDDYVQHVEQLMKQVLLTNPGERINRPDFGCGLRRMVFAVNNQAGATLAQVTILQALSTWLPTVVKAEKVEVTADQERMMIRIRYSILAREGQRYLNVEVTR